MLLPSALPCETTSTTHTRLQASLASPPQSPSALDSLYTTCRNLQSLLIPSSQQRQQPTPPISHASPPQNLNLNLKLRLRARNVSPQPEAVPRMRIAKRVPERSNKRRRVEIEDNGDDMDLPSTPKRRNVAPEILPLGLGRADFQNLHREQVHESPLHHAHSEEQEGSDNDEWTGDEDRLLVELVLEKLKLSKSEWQDCARSLGKDRGNISRRWKTLMNAGEVGIKRRSQVQRRGRVAGTWR